jgi:type I restriction-modification system DNA methylase subunit
MNHTPSHSLPSKSNNENLVKSRERVSDHGEVFTPKWMVEEMLDLVQSETERIDSRFLEPACGSGNFLKSILKRKLASVEFRYGKSEFERKHQALFALMCIYGIELLEDNILECRSELQDIYATFLNLETSDIWYKAGQLVLNANIIQGDALTIKTTDGKPIEFPEWGYLGSGKYQRRDFRYDSLTQRSSIPGTLFELFEEHQLFVPTITHPPKSVQDLTA